MKLFFEDKLNEEVNPQFSVINTTTGKYAGDPCLSKEEAVELAAQDEDRRVFELHKISYGDVPMYEDLNDILLDDNKFIGRALDSLSYLGADELTKRLKKIFSEIGHDECIRYAVELWVNDKYSEDDIIDTLYYLDETDE